MDLKNTESVHFKIENSVVIRLDYTAISQVLLQQIVKYFYATSYLQLYR